MFPSERNRRGYGLRNHRRPCRCEWEGPAPVGRGRDSAKRVVSETISPPVPLDLQFGFNFSAYNFNITLGFTKFLAYVCTHGYDELYARHLV